MAAIFDCFSMDAGKIIPLQAKTLGAVTTIVMDFDKTGIILDSSVTAIVFLGFGLCFLDF